MSGLYLRMLRPHGQYLRCPVGRLFATSTAESLSGSEPPTLLRMRADIKDAMKAKDANRLNVLRGFLAAADSASKSEPAAMRSESRVLALLGKQAKSARAAAAEFEAARRNDLKSKEEAQLAILEEYMKRIDVVPEDEVIQAVQKILSVLKANGSKLHFGNVMRDLTGRNGIYAEQPLDMDVVSRIVKERLGEVQ